jgi:hypothetical protein
MAHAFANNTRHGLNANGLWFLRFVKASDVIDRKVNGGSLQLRKRPARGLEFGIGNAKIAQYGAVMLLGELGQRYITASANGHQNFFSCRVHGCAGSHRRPLQQ